MNISIVENQIVNNYQVSIQRIVEHSQDIVNLFDDEVSVTIISDANLERKLDTCVDKLRSEVDSLLENLNHTIDLDLFLNENQIHCVKMQQQAILFYQSSQKLDYSLHRIAEKDRRIQERAILSGQISALSILEINTSLVLNELSDLKVEQLADHTF